MCRIWRIKIEARNAQRFMRAIVQVCLTPLYSYIWHDDSGSGIPRSYRQVRFRQNSGHLGRF